MLGALCGEQETVVSRAGPPRSAHHPRLLVRTELHATSVRALATFRIAAYKWEDAVRVAAALEAAIGKPSRAFNVRDGADWQEEDKRVQSVYVGLSTGEKKVLNAIPKASDTNFPMAASLPGLSSHRCTGCQVPPSWTD